MNDINAVVHALALEPHPEGGFYKEMHRAATMVKEPNGNSKNAYSSIYYLLSGDDFSAWHRIQSDETWFFHLGCDITIHYFDPQDALKTARIGLDSMQFQITIPANTWFAAKPMIADSFSLVSCVVGPAFTFTEFEIGQRQMLQTKYGSTPQYIEAIKMLTRI